MMSCCHVVPLFTSFELCEPQSALAIRHHLALGRDCVEMPVTGNSKGYVYSLHNTAQQLHSIYCSYTGGNLKVKLPMMAEWVASS